MLLVSHVALEVEELAQNEAAVSIDPPHVAGLVHSSAGYRSTVHHTLLKDEILVDISANAVLDFIAVSIDFECKDILLTNLFLDPNFSNLAIKQD